jgi:hypothetical protein
VIAKCSSGPVLERDYEYTVGRKIVVMGATRRRGDFLWSSSIANIASKPAFSAYFRVNETDVLCR